MRKLKFKGSKKKISVRQCATNTRARVCKARARGSFPAFPFLYLFFMSASEREPETEDELRQHYNRPEDPEANFKEGEQNVVLTEYVAQGKNQQNRFLFHCTMLIYGMT